MVVRISEPDSPVTFRRQHQPSRARLSARAVAAIRDHALPRYTLSDVIGVPDSTLRHGLGLVDVPLPFVA